MSAHTCAESSEEMGHTCMHACDSKPVKVRLVEVSSPLPPWFPGLNPGHREWQQVPLYTEPLYQPPNSIFLYDYFTILIVIKLSHSETGIEVSYFY